MTSKDTSARDANEAAHIRNIIEENFAAIPEGAMPMPRAQHAKHHGCVVAEFKVLPDIPQEYAVGIFAERDKAYKALVRFSNGSSLDDSKADAHGMAIKVLEVKGPKCLPGGQTSMTHDFVLVDHPVFFSTDLEEYAAFNKTGGRLLDLANDPNSLQKFLGIGKNLVKAILEDAGLVWRLRKFKSQKPSSPLASHYWSTTPYKLGDTLDVKYIAVTPEPVNQDGVEDENGLRAALEARLAQGPVVFDFGAHVKADATEDQIEDATRIWWPEGDEGGLDSFVPLATLTLEHMHPQTEWMSEHMVFSPWNALEAHEPLGVINRLRKEVYAELARRRHTANAPEGFDPPGTTDVP